MAKEIIKKTLVLFFLCLFLYSMQNTGQIMAEIQLSQAALDFGVLMRPKTKTLVMTVVNATDSPFLGSIEIQKSWVVASVKDISLATRKKVDVSFTVDSGSLMPGDYDTRVYFKDLLGNPKADFLVKMVVVEGKDDPVLKVREDTVNFKEQERGTQPLEQFTVENVGSGILRGKVQYPDWIKGQDTFEVHFTQIRPVYMRAYTNDLAPGDYTGEIKIETNGGNNTLKTFIKVNPRPTDPIISFSPNIVDFGTVKKGKKGRIKLKIINKGKGRLTGTVTYPDWIEGEEEFKEVEKDREFLIVADSAKLQAGLTKDVIKLTSDAGMVDIPVKIFIQPR